MGKESFTIQVQIMEWISGPIIFVWPAGPSPPTFLDIEIISVDVCDSLDTFLKQTYKAIHRALGNYDDETSKKRNGVSLRLYRKENRGFVGAGVQWGGDIEGRIPITEMHDGNVEAVLKRLRAREGCCDIVRLL